LGAEEKTRRKCLQLAKRAFLGKGPLDISDDNGRIVLRFYSFNPGREVQKDLVLSMAKRIQLGDCTSECNPLIVAVEAAEVTPGTLTVEGPNKDTVEFTVDVACLELLAGVHRVKAAQMALKHFRARLQRLENLYRASSPGDSEEESDGHNLIDAFKSEIAHLKKSIRSLKSWPVEFYDISERLL
jgi:hypothetical protein